MINVRFTQRRTLVALALGTFLGSASSAALAQAQTVRVDGSSTVFPITEAVAEEFQKSKRNAVKVTVGISGTGGGFRKFCRGETDVQNASRPITKSEIAECQKNGVAYIEMPVAYDALSVVVNPKNAWLKEITVEDLKKIWEPSAQGKIMRWNQVNPAWPDRPIKLFGAGTDSGTFDYFTEAVNGKSKASRGDFTASEDDNVLVQGISRDVDAIGFFGFAYYAENRDKLKALPISWKGSRPVAPTVDAVVNGTYQPLSRPIFIYVSANAAKRAEVREFAEFYNRNADKLVREVKYVSLPAAAYTYNLNALAKNRVGTKFGGENLVGVTIEQLLKLEAK
ncbi:MAG: PstS family phosphate ABC transporter substrate-binding protein [Betaproteobacteria bacterium]